MSCFAGDLDWMCGDDSVDVAGFMKVQKGTMASLLSVLVNNTPKVPVEPLETHEPSESGHRSICEERTAPELDMSVGSMLVVLPQAVVGLKDASEELLLKEEDTTEPADKEVIHSQQELPAKVVEELIEETGPESPECNIDVSTHQLDELPNETQLAKLEIDRQEIPTMKSGQAEAERTVNTSATSATATEEATTPVKFESVTEEKLSEDPDDAQDENTCPTEDSPQKLPDVVPHTDVRSRTLNRAKELQKLRMRNLAKLNGKSELFWTLILSSFQ